MKFLAILLVIVPATVFAAGTGMLEKDLNGYAIQGGAPNGELSQTLTVASTTVDGTGSIWWALYAPVDCKVRIMPTTAKSTYPQFTAVGGVLTSRLVNRTTAFINFSGCAGGELQRQ